MDGSTSDVSGSVYLPSGGMSLPSGSTTVTTGTVITRPSRERRVPWAGRVDYAATLISGGRREYECVFMQPGRVKQADQELSDWLIPAEVIRESVGLFDGVPCYVDHPPRFGFGWRQEPSLERLAGVTFDARWVVMASPLTPALSPQGEGELGGVMGGVRLYAVGAGAFMGALLDQILEDKAAGKEVPPVGLSAVVYQEERYDEEQELYVTTAFRHVESVDFVYDAGAGGYVARALAVLKSPRVWPGVTLGVGGYEMPETQEGLQEVPQGAHFGLEHVSTALERIEARLAALEKPASPGPSTDVADGANVLEPKDQGQKGTDGGNGVGQRVDALQGVVERLTSIMAEVEADRTIVGMGDAPRHSGIDVGRNSLEQVEAAFEALMLGVSPPGNVRPLGGIKDLYHLLSGDYEMVGLYRPDRVYLANVNCTTMAQLVANVLNKRVVIQYQEYPQWWAPIVSPEDFTSLQDARWITLGGVGELPTVSEGAAYTELTWDDRYESDAFVKKGGYLGITIEAIDKDDTGKLKAAPGALAQAAWMTLGKSISAIFTDNTGTGPAMSDTYYLFDATNHGNLLTAALSTSAWRAVKIAMQKQTEVNSGERLGALTSPRYLAVPIDLEDTAIQVLATEHDPGSGDWNVNPDAAGNDREARLANARSRVVTVPFWTDVNNWAAVADPRMYPSIGLGFRYGRTPEIFSVASPTAGLMFTNDTMPVKVRFFYAVGPVCWRGIHKNNVA